MLHLTDASLGVFAHLTGSLADEGVSLNLYVWSSSRLRLEIYTTSVC